MKINNFLLEPVYFPLEHLSSIQKPEILDLVERIACDGEDSASSNEFNASISKNHTPPQIHIKRGEEVIARYKYHDSSFFRRGNVSATFKYSIKLHT